MNPRAASPRHRALCLLLAASLGLGAAPPLQAQDSQVRLPALGESASDDFNLNQEKRVGEQIMREIRRDPDYLDDAPLLDYLQSLWQPLVQAARQRGDITADTERLFPYEPFLVRERSVNAFALPGGYVGVHLGLMALTATPDELASVLAHELSHITRRHIARSVAASSRSSSLGLAALLLGLLVAARASNADAAQAVVMGSQGAMLQAQLNFSRDMEREADRNGIALMGQAGFAPAGMAAMFDKLDQSSRLNDSGGFPYLRSHPLTVERIGDARQTVQAAGGALAPPPAPLLHVLMQARARVLMEANAQAWQRLQGLDARGGQTELALADRLAGLYTGALASLRLRDFDRAERAATLAQALLAAAPGPQERAAALALQRLSVQVALARGDAPRAAQLLAGPPDASRAGLMLRGELALADGSPALLRSSSEALQTWVADQRGDAGAWQLLAQTAERQGQKLRALRAEAEAQAALGNLPGAIDRLRAGQRAARGGAAGNDFIEASVIDARLRDLLAQRRQLLADERRQGGGRGGDAPE